MKYEKEICISQWLQPPEEYDICIITNTLEYYVI